VLRLATVIAECPGEAYRALVPIPDLLTCNVGAVCDDFSAVAQRVMNLLEDSGGRLAGTEFLFSHALDGIPEDLPPMEALARMALADPMVGPSADRAARIERDARAFGAEAVLVSRIPGASHCTLEGAVIARVVREELAIPVVEIEVPPLADPVRPTLRAQLEALVETVMERRKP